MPGRSDDVSPISSSLFAFKPRQVLLWEQQQRRVPVITTMAEAKPGKPAELKPEDESVLICSVALWLDNKGFSKVLKRFISAAQIKDDTWKDKALDLNEIFTKYHELCNRSREQEISQKKQEKQVDIIKETNGNEKFGVSEHGGNKKTRKKGKEETTVDETERISEGAKSNKKVNESNDSKLSKESNGEEAHESTKKQKDKKKKKSKSTPEALDADEKKIDVIPEVTDSKNKGISSKSSAEEAFDEKTTTGEKSKKKKVKAAENVVNESEKVSKKRKRMDPDENETQSGGEVAVAESKPEKSKGLEEGKVVDPGANGHDNKQNKEKHSVASHVGSMDLSTKQTDESTKGAAISNGVDKSMQQNSAKKQRKSSTDEPKPVNVFQRVKLDEVEFVDERLQDNSYWAKDGAETGYGAKAQEVLGQVKGRGFRHEKTKKKRGSYRGGQIDLQSHSIKFNYSDDE